MKRREFITLLGGAAAAWPLAARAQQREPMRRIGVLLPRIRRRLAIPTCDCGVPAGLGTSGWTDGRNVRIDTRWAGANADAIRTPRSGIGCARTGRNFGHGNAAVGALLQVTRTVPIVFPVSGDPVGHRIRRQLGAARRQRHRVFAFEFGLSGKWLEMLKQIAPGVIRAAVLRDSALRTGTSQFAVIQAARQLIRRGRQSGQHAQRRRDRERDRRISRARRMAV